MTTAAAQGVLPLGGMCRYCGQRPAMVGEITAWGRTYRYAGCSECIARLAERRRAARGGRGDAGRITPPPPPDGGWAVPPTVMADYVPGLGGALLAAYAVLSAATDVVRAGAVASDLRLTYATAAQRLAELADIGLAARTGRGVWTARPAPAGCAVSAPAGLAQMWPNAKQPTLRIIAAQLWALRAGRVDDGCPLRWRAEAVGRVIGLDAAKVQGTMWTLDEHRDTVIAVCAGRGINPLWVYPWPSTMSGELGADYRARLAG